MSSPKRSVASCLVGAGGREEERDVARHVQEAHRHRERVAADAREATSVPAREHVLEGSLDAGGEVEPPREALRDLAHRSKRIARARAGVRDRILDERRAGLRGLACPDVCAVEREHLFTARRVDEIERSPVLDVVAVERRRLMPVGCAPRGVEERDVVGVGEVPRGGSGELAEADREHGGA